MVESCQTANLNEDCVFKCNYDCMFHIFTALSPEGLATLARVCKFFYAFSKNPLIWKSLFSRYLCQINYRKVENPSIELQFKAVYKKFAVDRGATQLLIKTAREEIQKLIGPIDQASSELEEIKKNLSSDDSPSSQLDLSILGCLNLKHLSKKITLAFDAKEKEYRVFKGQLKLLAGDKYDGTDETASSTSRLGALLNSLNTKKKMFTNQKNFDKFLDEQIKLVSPKQSKRP